VTQLSGRPVSQITGLGPDFAGLALERRPMNVSSRTASPYGVSLPRTAHESFTKRMRCQCISDHKFSNYHHPKMLI
jgi:hypothetical protein